MIDRAHIEKVLKINGIKATAPDEEIRSVLISAKWHDDDVETALTVLRENNTTGATHKDTLKNVFNSDKKLSPEAIQSLLGIDVDMSDEDQTHLKNGKRTISFWQVLAIVVFGTILAFSSILIVMYIQNFGFFHPSVR